MSPITDGIEQAVQNVIRPYDIYVFDQQTFQWAEIRRGLVTGSIFASAIATRKDTRETAIDKLIAEVISDYEWNPVYAKAIEWGNAFEDTALAIYAQDRKNRGIEEVISRVGFIKSTKYDYLGLSPDAVVFDKFGNIVRAVEIKNPNTSTVVGYIRKPSDAIEDYKGQLLAYFIVIPTLTEIDFVINDVRMYDDENKQMVYTLKREDYEAKIAEAEAKYKEFENYYRVELGKFID